ncbi:MAG TPA: aminotransferase [Clostridiaceae bacterium]|nr:aminotransferase [Clostridiaceae bacterium]
MKEVVNDLNKDNSIKTDLVVDVEICRPGVKLPTYAHDGDAGMDVRAAVTMEIQPGETVMIPTGLKFDLPPGWEIQVRPRSGLSLNTPLRLANAPGTIDAGFKDELHILIHNSSCLCEVHYIAPDVPFDVRTKGSPKGTYVIRAGDRIAQLVFAPVYHVDLQAVEKLTEKTPNRGGGFGHSGF